VMSERMMPKRGHHGCDVRFDNGWVVIMDGARMDDVNKGLRMVTTTRRR
jgi:hypothetical protein